MNLKDYIHGQRHGKQANQLERDAMNDPFLQDAIDGYDSVQGNHASAIEELEKRLSSAPKRINKRVWWWAAAAVLVLLIGIPFLLRQPDIKQDIQVASAEKPETEQEIVAAAPQKDSVLVTDNFNLKKQEDAVEKIKEPQPATREKEQAADRHISSFIVAEEAVPQRIEAEVSETKTAKETKQQFSTKEAFADNRKVISGRVVDETGEPIIGATVMLKNSKEGVVTDTDGKFAFTLPKEEKGKLIASYIGMKDVETPLKENMGDIAMKSDDMALNEVVVTGYGTKRKSFWTGSTTKQKENTPPFGEKEFMEYFKENYDKAICKNQPIFVKVEFYVSEKGVVSNIQIKETSCSAIETEVKRLLLGSPAWSTGNRNVKLNIQL